MRRSEALLAALAITAVIVAFWKVQIVDSAPSREIDIGVVDLFIEHVPMTRYGFEELRAGRLPLWNPHQLAGVPFLAIPHTGLFYPPNWLYLFVEPGLGTELSLLLHLVFAGISMWWLVRALGLGAAGAFAASLTFALSGWMVFKIGVPALVSGMAWLPLSVGLVERSLRGSGRATLGFALAVAAQLLNGATEYVVYNLYVCALLVLFRLAPLLWVGPVSRAVGRGALLLGAVAAGTALAAAQLWPSLELSAQSARAAGSLSLVEALDYYGWIAPPRFARMLLRGEGQVALGVLPIFAIALGAGFRAQRGLWIFASALALLSMSLVFGGAVYRAYYETPLGGLFRRPEKFLHVFAFAQALLVGIALARLGAWRTQRLSALALWRSPGWLAALALCAGALGWLVSKGHPLGPWLPGALLLLAVYALAPLPRLRGAAVGALALLQVAALFSAGSGSHARAAAQADVFAARDGLFGRLSAAIDAGGGRIYMSPHFESDPALMLKQGMLRRLPFVADYEPLSPARSGAYFNRAAARERYQRPIFTGWTQLGPGSRFELMDLAGTRLYVVPPGSPLDRELARQAEAGLAAEKFRVPGIRVWERRSFLPRARFVANARAARDGDEALALLSAEGFDARREVVLEGVAGSAAPEAGATGSARIAVDLPERLEIEVDASGPGYLVLSDTHYPGWRASVGGEAVPILRANQLFRAVVVPGGSSRVRFEYAPASLRRGFALAGASALVLLVLTLWARRRARR